MDEAIVGGIPGDNQPGVVRSESNLCDARVCDFLKLISGHSASEWLREEDEDKIAGLEDLVFQPQQNLRRNGGARDNLVVDLDVGGDPKVVGLGDIVEERHFVGVEAKLRHERDAERAKCLERISQPRRELGAEGIGDNPHIGGGKGLGSVKGEASVVPSDEVVGEWAERRTDSGPAGLAHRSGWCGPGSPAGQH